MLARKQVLQARSDPPRGWIVTWDRGAKATLFGVPSSHPTLMVAGLHRGAIRLVAFQPLPPGRPARLALPVWPATSTG